MSKLPELAELQQAILNYSYKENHTDSFVLASGKKSPYYVNLKNTLLRPPYLKIACGLLLDHIVSNSDAVSAAGGLTMGADPLTYGISFEALMRGISCNPLVVRKEPKGHGAKSQVEGILPESGEVVLLEDVVTTGSSAIQAQRALHAAGVHPQKVFCVLDREEGGKEALENASLELYSLFSLSQLKNA